MAIEAAVLVDTNLLVQHLREPSGTSALRRSLLKYGVGAISVISKIEYDAGEIRANRRANFAADFPGTLLLPLSDRVLRRAPYIQARSISVNRKMDMADLLIAATATAIAYQLPLLTLNHDHFRHVGGLRLVKVL